MIVLFFGVIVLGLLIFVKWYICDGKLGINMDNCNVCLKKYLFIFKILNILYVLMFYILYNEIKFKEFWLFCYWVEYDYLICFNLF